MTFVLQRVIQFNIGVNLKPLALLSILPFLLAVPVMVAPAFADVSVSITHEQSECSECYTPSTVNIEPGDTVTWVNDSDSVHSVTSGNTVDGLDGLYDSSLLKPGKSFSHTFTADGQYSYHCMLHPWAVGYVSVGGVSVQEVQKPEPVIDPELHETRPMKTVDHVGLDVDPDAVYSVDYVADSDILTTKVDMDSKSVKFNFRDGVSDFVVLRIPHDVLSGVSGVDTNGEHVINYDVSKYDEYDVVTAYIPPNTKSITVYGATVIPEFGLIVVILAASVTAAIISSRKIGGLN